MSLSCFCLRFSVSVVTLPFHRLAYQFFFQVLLLKSLSLASDRFWVSSEADRGLVEKGLFDVEGLSTTASDSSS